jgi:hydroxymethylpyrimidine/phosphomethylpyrimidine kinase
MPTALTIAGSDSGGGAGIQADLKTFAAHGVYGLSAVTSVTAQNTFEVTGWTAVSAELVAAQIRAVASDIGAGAVKTGLLPNAAIVMAVAKAADELRWQRLVVDPVMVATSGGLSIEDEAVDALKTELLPRAYVVTPNVPEAERLSGICIGDDADRREAARRIAGFGAINVIIKGGHLPTDEISDLMYDGRNFTDYRSERVAGNATHGTGCTFAAAIAAHLALGHEMADAIPQVQRYVAGAIRHAPNLGCGHGPMDHFWQNPHRP